MSLRIYTKTGDLGQTSLIGGTRVPKSHVRIDAYGTIDELNSFVGLLSDQIPHDDVHRVLREVQDRLFTVGSSLASDPEKEPKMALPDLRDEDVVMLEQEIDTMTAALPPLRSFILPGGSVAVSSAHVARCVCRRAERACVNMLEQKMVVDPRVIRYLNRLSDYLFVLARYVGHRTNVAEIQWKPRINTRPH